MTEDNVPAGKLKEKKFIFLHHWSHCRKESDPELDPDPLVRGKDPQIRTKMSQISNTDA